MPVTLETLKLELGAANEGGGWDFRPKSWQDFVDTGLVPHSHWPEGGAGGHRPGADWWIVCLSCGKRQKVKWGHSHYDWRHYEQGECPVGWPTPDQLADKPGGGR